MWIDWIKTQSFVTAKTYFSPPRETIRFPPPQHSASLKHSLPVTQIYQSWTRLHLLSHSPNSPKRNFQQGDSPLGPVEAPKASFLCSSKGQRAKGVTKRVCCHQRCPPWAGGSQTQKWSTCATKSRKKKDPTKGGCKSQSPLKNEGFPVLFLNIAQRLHQLWIRRVHSQSRS